MTLVFDCKMSSVIRSSLLLFSSVGQTSISNWSYTGSMIPFELSAV